MQGELLERGCNNPGRRGGSGEKCLDYQSVLRAEPREFADELLCGASDR